MREDSGTRILEYLWNWAFFKYGEPDDLEKTVKAGVDPQRLFGNGDQNVDANCDPDLSFDGVLGIAVERLDPEMLLYPFEENLYLPAALV